MLEINGFQLDAIARPDHLGSEHFWPCVRVRKAGCLDAIHPFALRSTDRFDSKDPASVLAAAKQATGSIRSVAVRGSGSARISHC
jgi:hypothetical protein